jgi:hypothetical protein
VKSQDQLRISAKADHSFRFNLTTGFGSM